MRNVLEDSSGEDDEAQIVSKVLGEKKNRNFRAYNHLPCPKRDLVLASVFEAVGYDAVSTGSACTPKRKHLTAS